jgi:hypothetical protein
VASWILPRDHPSRPKAMICCFFSSFKTFAMLREATCPHAAVNVLDVSSESMAAFQVFTEGLIPVTERALTPSRGLLINLIAAELGPKQSVVKLSDMWQSANSSS